MLSSSNDTNNNNVIRSGAAKPELTTAIKADDPSQYLSKHEPVKRSAKLTGILK
jgi:hypothetical protein